MSYKVPTLAALREEYNILQIASGKSPAEFRFQCEAEMKRWCRQWGKPFSAAEYARAARNVRARAR
jgi:hypothetical protein